MTKYKPLYALYKGLKEHGTDLPDSYGSFERSMTQAGNAGASNRRNFYQSLKDSNYDVPDTYEKFYESMFVPVNNTTSRARKIGETPMTEEDRKGFTIGAQDIRMNASKFAAGDALRYNKLKQRKQKQRKDFGRVKVGTNKTPYAPTDNVVKDEGLNTYVTSDSSDTTNLDYAQQKQAVLDEQNQAYMNAIERGDIPMASETIDKNGLYDLQENIGKDGTEVTEKGIKEQAEARLNVAYQKQKDIMAQLSAAMDGGFSTFEERMQLSATKNKIDEEVRNLEALAGKESSGFWNTLADVANTIPLLHNIKEGINYLFGDDTSKDMYKAIANSMVQSNWDFGVSDIQNSVKLEQIRDKINKGEAVTKEEKEFLDANQKADKSAEWVDQYGSRAYRWTSGAGVSVPYMIDFYITGGLPLMRGMTQAFGRGAMKIAAKRGWGKLAHSIMYYTGVAAGDIIGSYAMATTVQGLKTGSDVLNRHLGTLYQDEKGNYAFGTFDENGNLLHEGGESFGKALYKGVTAAMLENYTEKMFGHWHLKSGAFDLLDKNPYTKKLADFFRGVGNKNWYLDTKKFSSKFGIGSYPEEVAEEIVNIPLNAWLVGDNSIKELGDRKTWEDIAGSMAISVGSMAGMASTPHIVRGAANQGIKAYDFAAFYVFKNRLNQANQRASEILGDEWEVIKNRIDSAPNENLGKISADLHKQVSEGKYSEEQLDAAWAYIQNLRVMRGYNLAKTMEMQAKAMTGDENTPADIRQKQLNAAYAAGQETEGENKHLAQVEYEKQKFNLASALGVSDSELENMTDEQISSNLGLDDNLDNVIYNYQNAKALYDGIMDNAQNAVDTATKVAAQRVDAMTNVEDGTIKQALVKGTMGKDDYPVYVISGNIETHDDGIINYSDSDSMIIVYNVATGRKETIPVSMLSAVNPYIQNAEEFKAQAVNEAKEKTITELSNVIDGKLVDGSQFTMEDVQGQIHEYKIEGIDEQGNCIISVDGTILPEPLSLDAIQQQYDQSNVARSVKNDQTAQEPEQIQQESQPIEDKFDYAKITNENDGKVKRVDVTDEEGKNRFPNAKAVFLIQDKGAMPKFVVMDEEGNLTSYVGKRGDKIHLKGEMTIDEYKKQRQEELQMIAAENADSSMIEDNSGTIGVEDNTQPLSETDADNVISQMESSAETAPDLELTPDNWTAEFGEDGILSTPIGDVKMGENQVAKLFEKGRSKEFGMIKPTLTNPDVIIEVPSHSADGNEERSSSYLFIKTFLGKNGEKVYYFKSVTIKKDGLEISISSHYDRAKRVKEALMKGKLLYRKNDGAQTEQNQPSTSVTTSQEDAAGSSESKDTNISSNGNENNESLTFEDGTPIPVDVNGEVDLSQTDATHAAEWYDNNLGEDADDWLDGEIKKAKKVLEQAKNKKLDGTKPSELVASKKEKEAAIADAQAHYDSAISIRDSLKERRIAKEENTSEGRKELIEKARRKFARLKSAVKDDAEAVSQLYRETIGSLLHRLYDGTGIDVTDTIPLTAEEYVASNLGAHSLNYEGTETSKGVKQETGLSREDFAKTQLLAADGKGTTIDALVHSLWENRPSNLESLDTQDIRNALLSIITSGFKASEARNYIENLRIAQAENILEEQKKAADNAAFAEEQKAKQEEEDKKAEENAEEKAEEKTHSESFNKIVDLAKNLEEILDNPDNVKEIDKITHEIDELLENLSDEEFKEVSDVLLNIDEDLEYLTADEYERREGVEESKKAKAYNESLQQAIKRIAPYADALKAAVKSDDKKAIAKARKELTDALLASNLGHGYLSGQLEYAKSAKKKDESYSERRALVKPLTDAIDAIESALDSALAEDGLEGVHVDFTEGGHGWIYADKGSAWSSRLKALDNDYRNVSQYETQNPISVLPQVTIDNVEKVAGIIKSRIEEGERYNSDEYNDEDEQTKFPDKLKEGSETIEVPEDATDENPLGVQRDSAPFSPKDNTKVTNSSEERKAMVKKNAVRSEDVLDHSIGKKMRKSLSRIAKMMGADIIYLHSADSNGWYDEKTNTIYLALDSADVLGTQFVFGHEMTHEIKAKNPAAFEELKNLVKNMMGEDAFNTITDKTQQKYEKGGATYWKDRNAMEEEVVADQIGNWIHDANYAHTLMMKMSHPLLAKLHEIVNRIRFAFTGTEYSDNAKLILRSIEQAYVKTAKGEVTNSETGEDVSFSLRQKPEPKKKGIGYKVFVLKDGKLYPPMVANPDGAATPVGVWLDADAAPIAGESKTGRPQVKQGGKGTQGGSGKLAYRPGWHLGVVPYAIQFNRKDADGNKTLFPKNFVFAEVEYAADVDYQEEARQEGINPSGKYQHSLAGLKHLPTDGYYMYRTNPNPETDPWVITGAMKVNRILTRVEQADLVSKAGREPQQIQEGDIVTDDVVNSINQEIADAPKFSLKVYHGSGADFTEFDFDHMGEGAGSQVFGWGGYVTSSKKIGKSYATLMDNDPSKAYYRIQRSNGTRFAKKYPTLESFLHGDKQIAKNDKFTEQEKIDYYNEMKKLAEPYHNLYEVDIPEDNGSNYLDWDKPLSKKQQDSIREGLEHLGVGIKTLESKGQSLERTGENIYNSTLYIGLTGTEYDLPERTKGISKFLSFVGFTGIKYKAGRNFGGAKRGDTNYVIFKPEDMKITQHTKFSLRLKSAIDETETNPSDAQKESGNYKKGHIKFGGYDYTIENLKGSTRSGKDADGKEWKVTMHDTYGYIRGKFGKDGDHLDMFINDKADLDNWNGDVFVVDQVNPDGSFDEHKVMYGYDSMDGAKKAYLANYSDGWQGLGNITGVSKDEFDKWLDTSKRKLKPFADYAKVKFSLKDNQGNPLNQDGTLKLDKIKSVDELTDEDFLHPTRNVELPSLPKKIADAIGTEGKPVVIKKNIFERNYMRHKDVTPELSKVIFKSALYNPDLYGQNQKKTRPYNWVLINTKDENGNNRTVLLEVNPNKDNVEIVHWHFVNDKNLGLIKKQAIREGDQVLILPSEQSEEVGGLSNLTDDLSAAKIDNSSETAKENGEKFSLKDEKIKSVAEKFGVNEDDVAMYANAVEKGSTAEAARARANIKRYLMQVNEGNIFSFKDVVKYTKPINEALKQNFGDLDAMIEERRKHVEAERNAMEAARKRAEEEEAKRKKHLEELSLIPDDKLDKQYMDALAKGDDATAREMLDDAARRKGYDDTESAYQGVGAWAAPGNPGYESDKARRDDWESSGSDVNLEDMALGYTPQPDDYFSHPERYSQNTPHGLESVKAINTAIDAIKNGEKDVKVKVYRAVPTSVKEGKLRNGDWVTPSKKYADIHGNNRLDGKYRIIEDEVPANQLWWDGNDANEFGFDDGKEYRYKNAKNNRKLNDLITYDNKGNVIPPSKRFNSRKNDIRFSLAGERGAADMAEDLKSLNTPDEVDDAIKTAIEDMPRGWKMANKKMIHIAQALGENRKAEIAGEEPKFSLKDGTLIKAGTYFSGGGLVEEGLKGIIDPVVAVEYDEKISGVYRNNFGQHIVTADVRDVDPKELVKQIDGEVEYFHASPVCKNYSQAKSNHAEVELDKETAASTAEFINAIKPKVVTIENVKGYKDSEAMKTITDALDANGYTWDADVYNAADYGGYTNRERLIVRAVRDGKLPEKPKKIAHKSGWYEAVADIIPTLTEKKNGVAPWMDIRLKADGIDWRNIDKPLYVMGSAYADGKVPHAFADELLPTLRTKSGDVIVMPDGKVYRAMGRVLARVSGVSDDYKMPFSESLSHTIIGNGIPTQLTEHVIAPLLTGSDPKFSIRTYHGTGASFDKFDLSHALEGEGSETFGHGVYVTNSSKIGREYAQRAKQRKMADLYKNMRYPDGVKDDIFKRRVFGEMVNDVATGGSVASAKEFAKKRVGADANDIQRTLENLKDREKGTEYEQNLKDRLAEYKDALKWIDSIDEDYLTQGNANRYDVDIPDDNGNYLGWNDSQNFPLEKWYRLWEITHHGFNENEYFKDGGARYDKDRIERIIQMKLDSPENGMQRLPTLKGEELYHALEDFFDRERPSHGAELASRALSEIGFVGIKYPAGLIHGGAEEGDYNYVIFDENNANIVGNTRFSLRGSTPYGKQMEEWMEKNHLEKGAVPMEKPIMKEGENIFDYANRMVEWTRNQNLWKTAPKQTGFQDALDKWKADNGLSPDAYPPVRPHRENYSTEIGYAEDLEEYNKKKELWKSAPKPKNFDLSVDLEDMNKQLRNIRRAVLNQKNYDQRTVKAVSDLVRKMLNIGWGDGLSRGKVGNLLSAAKNATGANDVKKYLDKAMGILAENYLNRLFTAYDNLINTKGARADQSGVIKIGSLDANGQAFMSEYKKAINMDDSSLNTYIANIEEDSAKNEDNVEMNDYRLAGIQAAIMYKQQIGGNDADIAELKRQIGELKNKKDATKEDKDLLKSLEKKLFENKFDRITMYENLLNNIQRMVKESKGRAKEFREEITEHKNEILHRANLDLEGVDSTYYDTTTAKKKLVNNDLQRAVFSSTYTFEQFLKFFGKKAANGEGYLYNYFTKLNQDALDEEQLYNEMNRNALDEKTKELFGKEKFMKLVGIDGKGMKEMDIEVTDYSNKETGKRTIHLKQGQMLYIYLVNKETDGEMKLRAMGITEEDVAAIEENLDPRVKAMGEWLQDEYLPECQRRYQATHTKYFGAPMKEVENYFPLAINNRARNVKEDVNQDSDAMSQLAGTSTGAIVTRRVNVIPLDIENADAFEVAFNHLQEMEEWSAMLPFRQDINTLLSYTHFRNQVQNMSSVAYGSGKTLWDEFKQTAQIAAGTYKPKVNAGMMDSRIAAAMGGIAVAKISGRLWTAIKQSQSATVFLPECDFTRFVKNGVNPYGSWKWAKENIPDFRKRIENITYGDVKLRQYLDELEKYHDWTKVISKWGMAPNVLVDGITCAVGARSVYETEVNRLTKLGYPKEKAEEKAYYKAVAAYNKTQQSSGGMYLSPMQVDRTYASAALSLFKNANYAYGRMQIEACRGLARTYDLWGGKHKTTLIESMTRQIMEEDGLDENTARAIAKATYNRTFRQSIGRLINFATLVPVSWALYKVLPYLLTGDDDDKKKDMIEEAVLKGFATSLSDNYVIPFVSNILNAGLKVEDGKPTFDPEMFRYQNLYINPATSDLANIYSMIGNQKWYSVANKLGMLGVQSLIGFNPETVGALYQAVSEADYDNCNTAKEWQIGILKAISAPEESIRELYMDELGLKSGDIKKIPLAELEKRYAERQINRDNLLSQIGMNAETFNGYVDKYQKSFEKKIKDKMDKWDEYDKKKADEFFDTTSDPKLKDMIEKKRTKDANAAADEQIAKEGLNQEKKGKEPSEEAYDAVKMSIDVAEDNAISTYNKVLNKRYAALNDEYNNQTDAMKYIFMSKHPNFKAYKDLESEYTTYGKKMKELKEKLVSADGYDAKQTILKQIRAEREKFSELQSKVR